MTPHPWSYSGLNMFVTCPAQYHAVKVLKTAADIPGEAAKFGTYLHKQFELRQKDGTPLPPDIAHHEPVMQELAAKPGMKHLELRVALDKATRPSEFFARNVWSRGVIDYLSIANDTAYIVDYKTGKKVPSPDQLALCALFVFAKYPAVQQCEAWYYMTRHAPTVQPAWRVFKRDEIPALWARFIPNLKQYAEAYRTDIWQARPSGLCFGFCPVKQCDHWHPRRDR